MPAPTRRAAHEDPALQFFDSPEQAIAALIVLAVLLLVAFPIHEFSHALAAYRLGDSTARLFGRLTLNPVAHFDPAGGLILALSIILSGGSFGFGWAKPTPVNPANLRGGRRGDALVALAGPLSNLVAGDRRGAADPLHDRDRHRAAGDRRPDPLLVLLDQPRPDDLQPHPDPAPRRLARPVRARSIRRRRGGVRAFLAQYGTLILMVAVFLPIFPGNQTLIGLVFDVIGQPLASILLGHVRAGSRSWWAAKVRRFRAHLRARVSDDERRSLEGWTTPPQRALFDTMHVADRRHGLDVVATLRAEGVEDPEVLVAGLLHDAAKGDDRCPAADRPLARAGLRRLDRPRRAARPGHGAGARAAPDARRGVGAARRRRRLLAADRGADPLAGGAARPRLRRAPPPRRRGELTMTETIARPVAEHPTTTPPGPACSFGAGRRPEQATQVEPRATGRVRSGCCCR